MPKVQTFKDLQLEQGSLTAEPNLDKFGRSQAGCPALGEGAELALPDYIEKPQAWHIGLGPATERERRLEPGLTLSIAGSPALVGPGERVELRAALENEFSDQAVDLGGQRDLILTFHFRYRAGHRDKQELYRCRVELPVRNLGPGEALDLTRLPGWRTPINGNLGDAFHLRVDTDQWRRGCRLRATARFVSREEETSRALQKLTDVIDSKEVLPVEFRGG